jgi:hypothetical protein
LVSCKPDGLREIFLRMKRRSIVNSTGTIRMKLITLTAAIAAALTFTHSAQAREHYHRHRIISPPRYFDSAPASPAAFAAWNAPGWLGAPQAGRPLNPRRAGARFSARRAGAWSDASQASAQFNAPQAGARFNALQAGYGGRPRAWCGWEMRQLVGNDPGPEFNLARNWAHWGRPGPAGVGAVVVWAHHVGKIVGEEDGRWIIQSGNDGNRVRTRPLPISGAIAIRWG